MNAPLWSADRHEPLQRMAWDEGRARDTIRRIAALVEEEFAQGGLWQAHPRDHEGRPGVYRALYFGACGTIWALAQLQQRQAVQLANDYGPHVLPLLEPNREDFGEAGRPPFASYLMGDTSIRMLHHLFEPGSGEDEIAALIEANLQQPTREFMWGSPGTLAAALFMHRRTGAQRFADLYRLTARTLWSQLETSPEGIRFWSQDMYGQHSDYIDAVHGFVGTAGPLILGRDLLDPGEWRQWQVCIADTVRRTAEWEDGLVNWRAWLSSPRGGRKLMQYCHGAPGFVVCLGDWPDDSLDDLLAAGAEATWRAGPLTKGPQLCHGTGGNGYALLKLWRRTQDEKWLDRARAFAMHGIAQFEKELGEFARVWPSLWTGHPGFALYLLDCIEGRAGFPTVDGFFVQ